MSSLSLAAILDDAKSMVCPIRKAVDHGSVLNELLKVITPVDFHALNHNRKPSKCDLVVLIIDSLISFANEHGWDLAYSQTDVYLYNGEYWKALEVDQLKNFLSMSAMRMGVQRTAAVHHHFQDELVKQFFATAWKFRKRQTKGRTLINLCNGTLEITQGQFNLRKFDKDEFLTYKLPFDYSHGDKCPMFEKFLNRVLPDIGKQLVLQDFISSIFIPRELMKIEKVLVLYGNGANGKSVLADIITALFGNTNISNYGMANLCSDKSYNRSELQNKLLNFSSEFSGKMDNGIFKQLASCEPCEVRPIYKQPYIMEDYAKLAFNCNQLPKEVENTTGYFRRFLIIEFDQTIPENERDLSLAQKIISAELPGVLNWVLVGLQRVLKNKRLSECDAVEQANNEYRQSADSVLSWIEDANFQQSSESMTLLKTAYEMYREYCKENGNYPLSSKNLRKRLDDLGFKTFKSMHGQTIYGSVNGYNGF